MADKTVWQINRKLTNIHCIYEILCDVHQIIYGNKMLSKLWPHLIPLKNTQHAYTEFILTIHAKDYVRISKYACRMHLQLYVEIVTGICGSQRVSADISTYKYILLQVQ